MQDKQKKYTTLFFGVIGILMLATIILMLAGSLSLLSAARIVFGSVYVLFLPGFVISFIFFPKTTSFEETKKQKGAIDIIERIALSFALSIAIVPLVVFYLNLIGIKITTLNSFVTILSIILISLGILYYKQTKAK